jgi:signal peptidase
MVRDGGLTGYLLSGVLLVLVVAFVLGQVLGQPMLVTYVTTGSMSPTIDPGDGFLVVPPELAGPLEEGDIVVFEAERLHGGGLTTHRIVDETDRGYVTRGDANPFTDQSSGEPPVQREQIVGVALTVGGSPVVIPHLGTPIIVAGEFVSSVGSGTVTLLGGGVRNLAYLLFGLGLLAYGLSILYESDDRRRSTRRRPQGRVFNATKLVVALTVAVVVVTTAGMAVASGTHAFPVVSADNDAPGHRVIETGGTETVDYSVENRGFTPVSVFARASDGAVLRPTAFRLGPGERAEATLSLTAPEETGYYRRFVTEHWYPGILPHGTLRALYRVHPWVPVVVIDLLVGTGFGGAAMGLVGLGRQRIRSRDVEDDSTWGWLWQ